MARLSDLIKLRICTICCLFIVIAHIAPQFSCQIGSTWQAAGSGEAASGSELAHSQAGGCNHRAAGELEPEESRQQSQARPRNQRQRIASTQLQEQQQQQQLRRRRLELAASAANHRNDHLDAQKQRAAHARQQRQFGQLQQQQQQETSGRSAAMMMMSSASQQQLEANQPSGQQQQSVANFPQPEEFSLAANGQQLQPGATSGASSPLDQQVAASSLQPSVLVAPGEQQNLTGSSYTLLSPLGEAPASTSASIAATSSSTTNNPPAPAATQNVPDLQSTSGQVGASTAPSSGEQANRVASTTTQQTSDSLSPPLNAQSAPATTTTTTTTTSSTPTTTVNSVNKSQPSVARQQQARRMEDGSSPANERHVSSAHAISSSPSSVSIITPLVGPPQQQQQQQQQAASTSSMMKPIYVLGQPLGEMDYTSISYEQQQNNLSRPPTSASQRGEKRVEESPAELIGINFHQQQQQQQLEQQQVANQPATVLNATLFNSDALSPAGERMNGPALVYSDGRLVGVGHADASTVQASNSSQQQQAVTLAQTNELQSVGHAMQPQQQQKAASVAPAEPRLFQGGVQANGAAVLNNNPRRPSLPPPVNQEKAASGFRSPLSPSGPLIGQPVSSNALSQQQQQQQQQPPASSSVLQQPLNSLFASGSGSPMNQMNNFYQASPPYGGNAAQLFAANMASQQRQAQLQLQDSVMTNKQAFVLNSSNNNQQQQLQVQPSSISNQFQVMQQQQQQQQQAQLPVQAGQVALAGGNGTSYQSRRPLNITRVEHISAECSNDLIRAVIVFNGTFKGIIYSSGYVNDPTCLYVNGSGLTRYEFSIRLNQCGTLGRQEMHQPAIPGEAKRRDQVMWNTLSIQYNSVIEQEWDEHFRVSCEYGSDFWKTISFSPFNVETNTGSPVVFTINPPQCQMDVLLGHGMGPKIAVDGPVTVGDPLTLLIHMKSEKAGYDILVKNCVAHNGGKQRMQLIDVNGCVVNERFISPFRGTYNDNDLRHVTLYAYLKAFRFTGSPVLYLECEIHMCQSACPPQMCYWRRLSKRSVDNNDFEYTDERSSNASYANSSSSEPLVSDSLSLFKALQVRHEPVEPARARQRAQALQEIYAEDEEAQLVCYRHAEVFLFLATLGSLFLLVLSVALTCCFRLRTLTRRNHKQQFEHSRLAGCSLSPSLLSISEPLSSANSVLSFGSAGSERLAAAKKQHTSRAAAVWQQQVAAQSQRQFSVKLGQPHHSPGSFAGYER